MRPGSGRQNTSNFTASTRRPLFIYGTASFPRVQSVFVFENSGQRCCCCWHPAGLCGFAHSANDGTLHGSRKLSFHSAAWRLLSHGKYVDKYSLLRHRLYSAWKYASSSRTHSYPLKPHASQKWEKVLALNLNYDILSTMEMQSTTSFNLFKFALHNDV
jgi:hypothetical protein